MPLPNLPRTPQGSHISRVQRSTPQTPQNLQYNREQWPSQISPQLQNMNNLLRLPYYAPNLMPSDWPSNQYVGHSNPNRSSEYMYLGLHNNSNTHSIDSNVSIPGTSPDIRYEELSPWSILFNSQMSIAESHDDAQDPLYSPHELNGGEPPINVVNSTPHNGSNDPNEFRSLPGYHGSKNSYQRFDCFDNCRFRRFGRRGFLRRGNMLVHLRSCHNQNIPRARRV